MFTYLWSWTVVAQLDLSYLSEVPASGIDSAQADDDVNEGSHGAFAQLVLPKGHKEMVLSLISQHFRNKQSPESNDENLDIVRGKGTPSSNFGANINRLIALSFQAQLCD